MNEIQDCIEQQNFARSAHNEAVYHIKKGFIRRAIQWQEAQAKYHENSRRILERIQEET